MNWEKFFAMGGYAFYVWSAYGLMAIVLGINLVLPLRQKSLVMKNIARRLSREGKKS